jgi:hypothetical protein
VAFSGNAADNVWLGTVRTGGLELPVTVTTANDRSGPAAGVSPPLVLKLDGRLADSDMHDGKLG